MCCPDRQQDIVTLHPGSLMCTAVLLCLPLPLPRCSPVAPSTLHSTACTAWLLAAVMRTSQRRQVRTLMQGWGWQGGKEGGRECRLKVQQSSQGQ